MNARSLLRIVTVGDVDHGKSTLLGRLLYDTDSLSQEQMVSLRAASSLEHGSLEFAFLLDAFLEEQSQKITIDTTQFFLRASKRDYLLIDAPGHKEFLKNMVTGAASATAAILLIDSHQGVQEQTRRHLQLLELLGIEQIIVAINKMDFIDYKELGFKKIAEATKQLFQQFALPQPKIIPIAARYGDNVVVLSEQMLWYQGPTLLEAFDQLESPLQLDKKPLRFVVQDVYQFDERRLISGRVESGMLHVGEKITFWPQGTIGSIRSIEEWGASRAPLSAVARESIAITLEEPFLVERGNIASLRKNAPLKDETIAARIFWLDSESLGVNQPIVLKLATQSVEGRVAEVLRVYETTTLQSLGKPRTFVEQYEVADVVFSLNNLLVHDLYEELQATGRFAIATEHCLSGGGVIIAPKTTHANYE